MSSYMFMSGFLDELIKVSSIQNPLPGVSVPRPQNANPLTTAMKGGYGGGPKPATSNPLTKSLGAVQSNFAAKKTPVPDFMAKSHADAKANASAAAARAQATPRKSAPAKKPAVAPAAVAPAAVAPAAKPQQGGAAPVGRMAAMTEARADHAVAIGKSDTIGRMQADRELAGKMTGINSPSSEGGGMTGGVGRKAIGTARNIAPNPDRPQGAMGRLSTLGKNVGKARRTEATRRETESRQIKAERPYLRADDKRSKALGRRMMAAGEFGSVNPSHLGSVPAKSVSPQELAAYRDKPGNKGATAIQYAKHRALSERRADLARRYGPGSGGIGNFGPQPAKIRNSIDPSKKRGES